MTPKISVIIPCYNEPVDVFCRSLESVISQTLKDIEIIIILDNPENHELEDIISKYQQSYSNILFLTPEKNLWRGNARNLWIAFAEGDYIAIHDADDVDMPERLEEQYDLAQQQNAWVVFSNRLYVDEVWNTISHQPKAIIWDHPSFFRRGYNHQTMFIKTELMKKYGGYKDLNFGEDTELWMRLFIGWKKIVVHPAIHSLYLSPEKSTHSELGEKMKAWSIWWMKLATMHFKDFYFDKFFYRFLWIALLDYLALSCWENTYKKWKKIVQYTMNMLRKHNVIKE